MAWLPGTTTFFKGNLRFPLAEDKWAACPITLSLSFSDEPKTVKGYGLLSLKGTDEEVLLRVYPDSAWRICKTYSVSFSILLGTNRPDCPAIRTRGKLDITTGLWTGFWSRFETNGGSKKVNWDPSQQTISFSKAKGKKYTEELVEKEEACNAIPIPSDITIPYPESEMSDSSDDDAPPTSAIYHAKKKKEEEEQERAAKAIKSAEKERARLRATMRVKQEADLMEESQETQLKHETTLKERRAKRARRREEEAREGREKEKEAVEVSDSDSSLEEEKGREEAKLEEKKAEKEKKVRVNRASPRTKPSRTIKREHIPSPSTPHQATPDRPGETSNDENDSDVVEVEMERDEIENDPEIVCMINEPFEEAPWTPAMIRRGDGSEELVEVRVSMGNWSERKVEDTEPNKKLPSVLRQGPVVKLNTKGEDLTWIQLAEGTGHLWWWFWESKSSMWQKDIVGVMPPRTNATLAVDSEHLYIVGGRDKSGLATGTVFRVPLEMLTCLHQLANHCIRMSATGNRGYLHLVEDYQFYRLPSMKVPRSSCTVNILQKRLIVSGGETDSDFASIIEVLDLNCSDSTLNYRSFQAQEDPCSLRRQGLSCREGNTLYFFGGLDHNGSCCQSVVRATLTDTIDARAKKVSSKFTFADITKTCGIEYPAFAPDTSDYQRWKGLKRPRPVGGLLMAEKPKDRPLKIQRVEEKAGE